MWIFLPFGFYSIVDKLPTTYNNLSFPADENQADFPMSVKKVKDIIQGVDKIKGLPFAKPTPYLCVRSRDKKSLENLTLRLRWSGKGLAFPTTNICDNQGSDYQYRMWVNRTSLTDFISRHIDQLDFNNFKNQADYEYKTVFGRVWSALWGLVKSNKTDDRQMYLFDDEEYYLEEEIDIFDVPHASDYIKPTSPKS